MTHFNYFFLRCALLLIFLLGFPSCMHSIRHDARSLPKSQVGVASWYGKPFHGRKTASGERFNMHELTAAHPSAAFGSRAWVTNLKTRQRVQVRINDRGPFAKGRIIDLSYAAAKAIGLVQSGTARVQVVFLQP